MRRIVCAAVIASVFVAACDRVVDLTPFYDGGPLYDTGDGLNLDAGLEDGAIGDSALDSNVLPHDGQPLPYDSNVLPDDGQPLPYDSNVFPDDGQNAQR